MNPEIKGEVPVLVYDPKTGAYYIDPKYLDAQKTLGGNK